MTKISRIWFCILLSRSDFFGFEGMEFYMILVYFPAKVTSPMMLVVFLSTHPLSSKLDLSKDTLVLLVSSKVPSNFSILSFGASILNLLPLSLARSYSLFIRPFMSC